MKITDVIAENIELNKIDVRLVIEGYQDALKLAESLEKLKGEEITVKAEKVRKKRSLNANSYYFTLAGEIAEKSDSSKDAIHNRLLSRYGQYMKDKDDNIVYCLYPADIDYEEQTDVHLKPTGHIEHRNGVKYEWFIVMRGSHTYNTKEMAILIDGAVSEAKELGIDTITPDEVKRMVASG